MIKERKKIKEMERGNLGIVGEPGGRGLLEAKGRVVSLTKAPERSTNMQAKRQGHSCGIFVSFGFLFF